MRKNFISSDTNNKKHYNHETRTPVVVNRDGSLNIHRPRERGKLFSDLYHYFLSISWPKFFGLVGTFYLLANLFFAAFYFLCGADALAGIQKSSALLRFADCFFFSVQTMATIGYGRISPVSIWANLLVAIEAFCGVLGLAIITGVLYGRFSRPTARVIFSNNAIITQYNGRPCFVFRVANARLNQIVEAHMTLTLTKNETSKEGETSRKFYNMKLERDYSPLFALSWTLRHFIDEDSPLFGMDENKMRESQVVIFASLLGMDDTFSQTITARSVYRYDEIVYNKSFKDILLWENNKVHINLKGIHDTQ